MAVRRYHSDMSQSGLDNLVKQLQHYKTNIIVNQLERAMKELLDMGIIVADSRKGEFESFITFRKQIDRKQYGIEGIMLGLNTAPNVKVWYTDEGEKQAEISSILMAEFGSGVHAESSVNIEQKGHRGTFPNQTHAFQKEWYYATRLDDKGKPTGWVKTDGIEPTSPMYFASMEMYQNISNVIVRAFR